MATGQGAKGRLKAHRDLVAISTLAATVMAVFSRTLFLGQILYREDTGTAGLPWFVFLARQRQAGNWLPWCSDIGCGFPLWANMNCGAFYPPNWLGALPLPLPWLFAFLVMSHYILGAAGMYVLARMFHVRRLGAER